MPRAAQCLGSLLRPFITHNASSFYSAQAAGHARWAIAGFRGYVQVALKQERQYPPPKSSSSPENFSQSAAVDSSVEANVEWERTPSGPQSQTSDETFSDPNAWVDESGWSPDPTRRRPTDRRREEFFSRLFSPLKFPPELAHRTLTHNSHSMARQGHNAALAFIGRRVIAAYFIMFLHSSRQLKPADDVEDIAARSLNTHLLGEYVGSEWGVGRELVWAPSISEDLKAQGHLPGLCKVQGETVQAIMGAINHQYGGVIAHRVFHTRVLPLLLVNGGVPNQFHKEALKICNRMGGSQGSLSVGEEGNAKKQKVLT